MNKKGVLNIQKTNGKTIHHVEIGIKKPEKTQVLAVRKMTLRDRFLNAIFGDGHKMVVLVPGESVGTISITEMEVHKMDMKQNKNREEQVNESKRETSLCIHFRICHERSSRQDVRPDR